ncbi:protein NRT1/ PTR FAMILY 5.4-like [Spinacia oleracea]|uniref:Protein NRT1/ PTR FAMILY 5.4-like n=1 Tax=Spinacia oleracea TaxID=3562 RepID=A0ABM3QWR9_SPIOL|nr:protein NRT1/ PTR FAMILY 5.4-like [Spinacia oleracea]
MLHLINFLNLTSRCLDKAMMIDDKDLSMKSKNPWRLCSVKKVEEVKLIIRLLPIWICTFAYAIIVAQVHTFFIKQASTMNRSIGHKFEIPPAYLQVIPGFTILVCVPLYDILFVPSMRNLTKTPLRHKHTPESRGSALGWDYPYSPL